MKNWTRREWYYAGLIPLILLVTFLHGCAWWNAETPNTFRRTDSQRMKEQLKPDLDELEQVFLWHGYYVHAYVGLDGRYHVELEYVA